MNSQVNMEALLLELLDGCCSEQTFSADVSLVSQGLGSLAATRFVIEVEARFGIKIGFDELVAGLCIQDIAQKNSAVADINSRSESASPIENNIVNSTDLSLPLLPLQQAFLVTSDADYSLDPVGCHIYREFDIHDIDGEAMLAAWTRLVQRHPVVGGYINDQGRLAFGRAPDIQVSRVADCLHGETVVARRRQWVTREGRLADGLLAVALVLSPEHTTLVLSVDAMIIDGHGLVVLLEDWRSLAQKPDELPDIDIGLVECLEQVNRPYPSESIDYWKLLLASAPAGPFATYLTQKLELTDAQGSLTPPIQRRSLTSSVPANRWRGCCELAKAMAVSPSSLIFAVFCDVVMELDCKSAASFLLTTSERPRLPAESAAIVGPFTSSLVVPVATDNTEDFEQFGVRLHREIWGHLEHGMIPAVVALRMLPKSAVTGVLPVVFTSLLGVPSREPQFTLRPSFASCQTSGVALEHQMWEVNGDLVLHWDVADELLPNFAAELAFNRVLARIEGLVAANTPGPILNKLQQSYFILRSADVNYGPNYDCNAVFSVVLDALDVDKCKAMWRHIVRTHPALRSIVCPDGSVQILDVDDIAATVGVTEVSLVDLNLRSIELEAHLLNRRRPLGRWPLQDAHILITSSGAAALHMSFDLLMLDGKSIHGLAAQMISSATGSSSGDEKYPVNLGVDWGSPVYNKDYWVAKMARVPSGPARLQNARAEPKWSRMEARLDGFEDFSKQCIASGIAPDCVLIAALAEAWRNEVSSDFTLPVVWWLAQDNECRPAELSQMAWPSFEGGTNLNVGFSDLVRKAQDDIRRDLAAGGLDGLAHLSKRYAQGGVNTDDLEFNLPLVYTSLVQWADLPRSIAKSLRWRTATPGVSVDAVALVINDQLLLAWDCIDEHFPEGQLRRIFDRYKTLVARALASPSFALVSTEVDSEALPGEPLYDWLHLRRELDPAQPAQIAFENAVDRHRDAIAVRWRDGSWTFDELNKNANRLARVLMELGVGPDVKVALSLPRGPWMVAATFAVLKAGGAYVPVDITLPQERAERILFLAECSVVVTQGNSCRWVPDQTVVQVSVEDVISSDQELTNPSVRNSADTIAYVIFTSGSTGDPKGVAVNHHALHNLFQWCQRTYNFGASDLGLCVTSLGFDLSVFDILGLLSFGAGIYVADETEQRDPSLLAAVLVDNPITFWNSAPTTLDQVRSYFPDIAGRPESDRLRLVFLSGDYTPLSLPADIFKTFPNARLVSLGGATEATVWSNYFEVTDVASHWRSIPYGRPIDNARYYILDETGQPCAAGVEGDLFIAGQVLSVGYYGQTDLTKERFVTDPFVPHAGERMYRTGDRARFFPDGCIEFRGRADRQVKIRGVRIELEEIEHAVRQHPQVRDVVVLPQRDPIGDIKLVAYAIGDTSLEPRDILAFVAEKLPPNMVPNLSHVMDEFPITSNGKLDRASLPWPLPAKVKALSTAMTSVNLQELTAEITQIFLRFLGVEPEPDQDLWELGATSFTMVQVSGALRSAKGVRMQVEWLTRTPTVRGIATEVASVLDRTQTAGTTPVSTIQESKPSVDDNLLSSATDRISLFDADAKAAFLAGKKHRRHDLQNRDSIALSPSTVPNEWFQWRASQRNFNGGQVPIQHLSQLLGLLNEAEVDNRTRRLYPSAGDTYGVQIYLWVKPDRVENLDGGYYWFDATNTALVFIGTGTLDRNIHFVYNRPSFDESAFTLFLVGENDAVQPLYGADTTRYLLLEAGYIGQLLMLGQNCCDLGLCPIGDFDETSAGGGLGLGQSHKILHSFFGGPTLHPKSTSAALPPLPLSSLINYEGANSVADIVNIVGHALRYPGAETPDEFWALLSESRRALGPMPRRRGLGGSQIIGGFLEDIESFDAMVFGITPNDAKFLDPQARLLMEVVWECLERAAHSSSSLQANSERVGVFVGHLWHDYRVAGLSCERDPTTLITATGSELANRVSAYFGFTGPSIAVDTSCSSGLSALHLAAMSILGGDCESAIVCAVNLVADVSHLDTLTALGLVADANGGAYDAHTTGWAVGEGAGAVLLRRNSALGAEADNVLAVLSSTHMEHVGARARFGSPDASALCSGIRAVLNKAQLSANDINYVESAASGAAVSDATEWQALSDCFPQGVAVGTVKPNIGHLEAASGLSQLSKALLQLEHGRLAPTHLSTTPTSLIDLNAGSLRLITQPTKFDSGGNTRRILINAVGGTGSSAQIILSAPDPDTRSDLTASGPQLMLISAATTSQLETLVASYINALRGLTSRWPAVCATTQLARRSHRCRLVVEATNVHAAISALEGFLKQGQESAVRFSESDPSLQGTNAQPKGVRGAVEAWLAGYDVNWHNFWDRTPKRLVLPTYPFDRKPHWVTEHSMAPALAQDNGESSSSLTLLRELYSRLSGLSLDAINAHVALENYGLNSALAKALISAFNATRPGSCLPPTVLYEHRDLASLARFIDGHGKHDSPASATHDTKPAAPTASDSIAVVGLSGRYPGAVSADDLWQQLLEGRDQIGPMPLSRRPDLPGDALMRGAFLEDVAAFDPYLFGITPLDAARMDPQERILLELVWQALEDACYPLEYLRDELAGNVGVFVGAMHNDYPFLGVAASTPEQLIDTGATTAGIANRISYHLDIHGPSVTVDTMCSSALTAIHLAMEALRAGRIQMAIVASANLTFHPNKYVQQARLKMTSVDGRCRSFGQGGDGFIPGEGAGVIVLRPMADAKLHGDNIHGSILGSAVNHGGKVNGFTVPNPQAQTELVRAALKDANVSADTISYVEAHGTGTALGDPIETRALAAAMDLDAVGNTLSIGSIKSNIGHLEGAAGIAGVTKVLLQMRHKTLVPSLHSQPANEHIDWSYLRVPSTVEPWLARRDGHTDVWRAGVSAFGAGGSNAHLILAAHNDTIEYPDRASGSQIMVLSAATKEALEVGAVRLADWLSLEHNPPLEVADVAANLQLGRSALKERWAHVCGTLEDTVTALRALAGGGGFRGRAQVNAGLAATTIKQEDIARQWVGGAQVQWQQFHPQRWRRLALPTYSFSRVRCWLDTAKDGLSVPDRQQQVAPPLLCERVWRPQVRSVAPPHLGLVEGKVLCLVDEQTLAFGHQLATQMSPGRVTVRQLDTDNRNVSPDGLTTIVVMTDPQSKQTSEYWKYPFDICRDIIRGRGPEPLHILQVVSGLHAPSTAANAGSGALLAGLLHALATECAGVMFTCADVGEVDFHDPRSTSGCSAKIMSELSLPTAGDVYIGPFGRLLPCWQDLKPNLQAAFTPTADALYIVTGGTRGLGASLARSLVQRGARNLALMGRRAGPDVDALVADLETQGAVVSIHYGSIEDVANIKTWFDNLVSERGPLTGVFHCAGVGSVRTQPLLDKILRDIQQVALPKVDGLAAILSACEQLKPQFVLAFSSISAVVASSGVGVGEYASANRAMECLAEQAARRSAFYVKTVAWPVWDSSTAGAGARATMERLGLPVLTDEQAFAALWASLSVPSSGRLAAVSAQSCVPTEASSGRDHGVQPPQRLRESAPESVDVPAWLLKLLSVRTGIPVDHLDINATFAELGVESIMLGNLVADIESCIGRPISPDLLISHPTVESLARYLIPVNGDDLVSSPDIAEAQESPQDNRDPAQSVAIIGMAVRVPGASDIDAFWELLIDGQCAISTVPSGRWNVRELYDVAGKPGKSISCWGGFLDGIENFDPEYFNLTEQAGLCLDPAIRLFMEGTVTCLHDAGFRKEELMGRDVGVFVGGRMGDYRLRVKQQNLNAGLGTDQNFIAAHVAHYLDIKGCNLLVDSACSSALTATHLACNSVLSGESELALTGGVDVLLDEEVYVEFTKARALSASGRCRTFDQNADGFVPGEGCVVLLLKRLDNALRDGDRIHAVIDGSAVNNDGRTMGLTTPNPVAQQAVITSALKRARRAADKVGLVEAHGTGTMIGDPIELKALNDAFRAGTDRRGYCAVGSVKSNIGHLLSAAGSAGLAKAILAVKNGLIPPTLFCETPNPRFDLATSPFFIPTTTVPWSTSGVRVAGVSAFGLGGTNAHILVSEAPSHTPTREALTSPTFNRRKLWLDNASSAEQHSSSETLSLLDLQFTDSPDYEETNY